MHDEQYVRREVKQKLTSFKLRESYNCMLDMVDAR